MTGYLLMFALVGLGAALSVMPASAASSPNTPAPNAPAPATPPHNAPLSLHPQNPHYFLWRGQPTVLITSGEHYGAVLNLDFDYVKYLDTLAADGLNLTRTFSGAYVEPPGAFNIASNTLAPKPGRFLCPWARSTQQDGTQSVGTQSVGTQPGDTQTGYANGGSKFDLSRWDEAYFVRLKDFVEQASRRGIVVEVNLFCPLYDDSQWAISPLNAANNINGVGAISKDNVYTLDKNGGLLAVQEAMVRKIVAALGTADNVYYEICNEPYFGGVTLDWQHHMADVITEAERALPQHHLISQNIANGSQKIERPHPAVAIFNFHYAHPPTTVAENFALNKVIGLNETGFQGTADAYYRREAWEFVLAGGALYNNLDYSFTCGHEDGTFAFPATQPGGGGVAFRHQMKVLKEFMHSLDFVKMHPAPELIQHGLPPKSEAQALAEPGRQYAFYLKGTANAVLSLALPGGTYHVVLVNVLTGQPRQSYTLQHGGGNYALSIPADNDEIAIKIVAF